MAWRTLLLLGAVLLQDDAGKLVEKLGSEDVEEREAAARGLRELGRPALESLERAARSEDREIRGRAADLLRRIQRDLGRPGRIAQVRPPLQRLSLDLENAPLQKAASALFDPYGVAVEYDMALNKPGDAVSLRIKDATLWEALEEFCRATGAAPWPSYVDDSSRAWRFLKTGLPRNEKTFTKDDVHLVAQIGTYAGPPEWKGDLFVRLHLLLPPGGAPRVKLQGVKILGDAGQAAEPLPDKGWPDILSLRRTWGKVTSQLVLQGRVPRKDEDGARTLKLAGELSLFHPHDLDRVEIDLATFKPPLLRQVGRMSVKIEALSTDVVWAGGFEIGPSPTAPRGGVDLLHIWGEDEKGRWVGDLLFREVSLDRSFGLGMSGNSRGKNDPTPARFVLAAYEGEEVVKVPFSIGGLAMPDVPKD